MEPERPEIFVLSGPNGAGKTTTASVLLPERLGIDQFVNADLIDRALSPFSPERTAFRAGRLMLDAGANPRPPPPRRELRIRDDAGHAVVRAFPQGRSSIGGYLVHLIYIWLSSVDLAISRVRARVAEGGHDVPPSTVERRYHRGLRNLFGLYQPLCDTWTVSDNSGDELIAVARGSRAERLEGVTVVDAERWSAIRRMADDTAA